MPLQARITWGLPTLGPPTKGGLGCDQEANLRGPVWRVSPDPPCTCPQRRLMTVLWKTACASWWIALRGNRAIPLTCLLPGISLSCGWPLDHVIEAITATAAAATHSLVAGTAPGLDLQIKFNSQVVGPAPWSREHRNGPWSSPDPTGQFRCKATNVRNHQLNELFDRQFSQHSRACSRRGWRKLARSGSKSTSRRKSSLRTSTSCCYPVASAPARSQAVMSTCCMS